MIKNQNIKPSSFISQDNQIKNHNLLIQKLKESLKLQKQFIKEIQQKLQVLANNEVENKININPDLKDFMDEIPFIIKDLGIPFAHNFIHDSDIYFNLLGLYFDKKEKNDEKSVKKIEMIFEACMDVFQLIMSNDELNKIREYLLDLQIIKEKDKIIDSQTNTEKLYEDCNILLSDLKTLIEIGKDKEKIEELEKKYKNLTKDIKIFSKNSNPAEFEFFNELIQEADDYFKNINLSKPNDKVNKINEDKKNEDKIYKDEIVEKITYKPLDQRTSFYLDEKIKEKRNEVIEFKNYHFPLTFGNKEEIKQLICGFLNSKGGRLYLGINGQNLVKGVVLNSKARDTSRNELVNLTYDFYPNCRTNKIWVDFIPVKDAKTQKFISKKYIIKVRVYPGDPEFLYSMTSKGYRSYMRRGDQCLVLNSIEIYNEIKSRDDFKQIKNQDNVFIQEMNIRDPEPEKNDNEEDYDLSLDLPFFGVDSNDNLSENVKNIVRKNEKKYPKKKKNNSKNEGTFIVKIENIDETLPKNVVNRTFNNCRRFRQEIMEGFGFLYFSNLNDANNCIAQYNGYKLGNKNLKLNLTF